jgi:hypothetical protein
MTAPVSVDAAALLRTYLEPASPDLMRAMVEGVRRGVDVRRGRRPMRGTVTGNAATSARISADASENLFACDPGTPRHSPGQLAPD